MINWSIKFELKEFLQSHSKKKILDFGCGDGRYKEIIKEKNTYVGVDVEVSGKDIDDKNFDILFDKNRLPFEEKSFDIIIFTEVLEHVEDLEKTIKELKRVLKNEGLIFVTTPFMWVEHEKPYDFRRLTSFGIKKLFIENDFHIVSYKKLVTGKSAFKEIFIS